MNTTGGNASEAGGCSVGLRLAVFMFGLAFVFIRFALVLSSATECG